MLKQIYQQLTEEAFRLFFSLTAIYASVAIFLWILVLNGIINAPTPSMDSLSWHLHELIFGVSLAALLGFLFTALPSFLSIAHPPRWLIISLAASWLGARASIALNCSVLSGLFHWLILLGFAGWAFIPLFKYRNKGHTSFAYTFIAFMLTRLGFDYAQLSQSPTLPWLHAALGILMLFILLALGRISFRIVNMHLKQAGSSIKFIPRPPMRHIALGIISLFIIALLFAELQFKQVSFAVLGWLALASTCAIINLFNDWRIGTTILKRYPLMIASIYALMALGFASLGIAYLTFRLSPSIGWHLLGIGTLGLSLFTVMSIAGRLHSQKPLNQKRWVNIASAALVFGAILRGSANLYPTYYSFLLNLTAFCWLLSFVLYSRHFLPLFSRKR